jgi:hypothetical protein
MADETEALREAYAALNRNGIPAFAAGLKADGCGGRV